MKHFLIKLNHAIEIGAYEAYSGHYARTLDVNILAIMCDEKNHRRYLKSHLLELNQTSNFLMDSVFYLIGSTISFLCYFCPIRSLNYVANIMEIVATVNYDKLAELYPDKAFTYREMSLHEKEHGEYFKNENR